MMVYQLIGDLFLVWKDAEPLTDAEWDPMVEVMRGHRGEVLKVLVITMGGAPTPSQQLKLTRLRIHRGMTIAVLSTSVGVRFVASSVALFARQIRTFVPTEFASACAFLELTEAQVRAANDFFAQVRRS